MLWAKDGNLFTASHDGIEFFASKTYTCPATPIPASHRWTFEVHGPWYMCKCFPRLIDCYAAAERVIAALPILDTK